MNLATIHKIVHHFYNHATQDIWIGYHFRHIQDLEPHIERISRFWYFQYHQTKIDQAEQFNLIETHMSLQATTGHLNRWIVLFKETLDHAVVEHSITENEKDWWMQRIEQFKNIFLKNPQLFK